MSTAWSHYQLGLILGIQGSVISRWRNGLQYPNVSQMKKIEAVFGWPASEQIDLLPLMSSEKDPRWSLVFNDILREWMDANPRTTPTDELQVLVRTRKAARGRPGTV
jgi:hypothetical protein